MAYQTLYNRYRPIRFADVVGQEATLRALKNQVISGRVGHAYLFSGPRGIGKTTIARIFARAINCSDPREGESCGVCAACRALSSDRNMDILEIDAASNNGVDHIRELRENVGYLPAQGKYRVYIIDEVHMLSASAFNALLKTLEEPPEHAVFLLATTEVRKLPATVLSRCQRYEFHRLSTAQILGYMENLTNELGVTFDARGLAAIARTAEGGMRDALTMLEQCLPMADEEGRVEAGDVYAMLGTTDRRYYFTLADAILQGDAARALSGLVTMVESGCDPVTLAQDLQRHFRELLLVTYGQDPQGALGSDESTAARLTRQAAQASPGILLQALGLFTQLEGDMRYAAMPRTYLELAVARSCRLGGQAPEALLARVEALEEKLKKGVSAVSIQTEVPPPPEEPERGDPVGFSLSEDEWREEDTSSVRQEVKLSPAVPDGEHGTADDTVQAHYASAPMSSQATNEAQEADLSVPDGKAVPEAGLPQEAAKESFLGGARQLWREARSLVETRNRMVASYMAQGRGKTLEEMRLVVTFPPQQASARMALERERNRMMVLEALRQVLGRDVTLMLLEEALTDQQQIFIQKSLSMLPTDRVELEFDD